MTVLSSHLSPRLGAARDAQSQPRAFCGLAQPYAMRAAPALGTEPGALAAFFGGEEGSHRRGFFNYAMRVHVKAPRGSCDVIRNSIKALHRGQALVRCRMLRSKLDG